MIWALGVAVTVGVSTVVQGAMNRSLANPAGLSLAVFINAIVFLVASMILLWIEKASPSLLPELFRQKGAWVPSWWHAIPGLAGFVIVSGIPFALTRIGATRTFIVIIAAQLILSAGIDFFAAKTALTPGRIAGCVLTFVGACLALWSA